MCSRHSHQLPPKFCGRQWRVIRATEGERFLFLSCLWRLGFRFEFNVWWRLSKERGHVAHADLRVLMAWPLGFLLLFSFLRFLVSKTLLFPSFWFFFLFLPRVFVSFACFCDYSDSTPATLTLLRRRISPTSTVPLFKVCYFFDFFQIFSSWPPYKFLIFPLSFTFLVSVFDMWAFRIGYPFSWLVLLRFG